MKRPLFRTAIIVLLLAIGAGAWLFGYHTRKNLDNVPSRELLLSYLQEQGEAYATKKVEGYSLEGLSTVWGQPDGELFGMFGCIWESGEDFFIVYFDQNAQAQRVILGER